MWDDPHVRARAAAHEKESNLPYRHCLRGTHIREYKLMIDPSSTVSTAVLVVVAVGIHFSLSLSLFVLVGMAGPWVPFVSVIA